MSLSTEVAAVRILIVDDQISNVRMLDLALRRAGYAGVTSTTDPTAVTALQLATPYDLILLDLQMPGMTGFQVMEQLRAEKGPRPAILVISADPALMVAALEAGADGFLSKPFRLPDVMERVQLLLGKTTTSPA